jgi:hypothetical protein
MQPLNLEPGMEALLKRYAPAGMNQLQGASEDEIAQIERLAGHPLPGFYRWFLSQMGRSMGPFGYPSIDFSPSKVLSCYAEGLFLPDRQFLMIGYQEDEMMPLHLFYDFDHPARDDARVVTMEELGGPVYIQFETFREMVAWGVFLDLRVDKLPQVCRGLFVSDEGDVLSQLHPIMGALGLKAPPLIPTGPCCAMYDGDAAAMVMHATPKDEPRIHGFFVGADNAGTIRRILGAVATNSSLSVEIKEWTPALA